MHVQSGCSGNDSDVVIPSMPSSGSQPTDSPHFLKDGFGTKHRVWFQRFGTSVMPSDKWTLYCNILMFRMTATQIA